MRLLCLQVWPWQRRDHLTKEGLGPALISLLL